MKSLFTSQSLVTDRVRDHLPSITAIPFVQETLVVRANQPARFRISAAVLAGVILTGLIASPGSASAANGSRYLQTNLVSDVAGWAPVTDAALVNPWGLSRSATSPWWVADNGTGLSTLYTGAGAKLALVVTVPPAPGQPAPSAPTGTVFNGSSDFQVGTNQPARFLFVTEDGALSGWNPAANATVAINKVNNSGNAVYKGLAIGQIAGANYLYAANFYAGTVDVFDRTFAPVNLGATAFVDPELPPNYAPFNVQAIGNWIYVAYAKQDEEKIDEVAGAGRGFVSVFSTAGVLHHRLEHGGWLNAPWGIALSPANFGRYSNMILIGQFGSGKIAAFDPATGYFTGLLRSENHQAMRIDGLWALSFGNGAGAGPLTTLYFTAGPEEEAHGLFGSITPIADQNKGNGGDDDESDEDAE